MFGLLFAQSYKRYTGFVDAKADREPTALSIENRLSRTFAGYGRMYVSETLPTKRNETFRRFNYVRGQWAEK